MDTDIEVTNTCHFQIQTNNKPNNVMQLKPKEKNTLSTVRVDKWNQDQIKIRIGEGTRAVAKCSE